VVGRVATQAVRAGVASNRRDDFAQCVSQKVAASMPVRKEMGPASTAAWNEAGEVGQGVETRRMGTAF
jgi:hypothetical protein